jgi:hypothetical protein
VEDGFLDAGTGELALEGNIESMQQDDIRSGRQLLAEPDRRSGDRRENRSRSAAVDTALLAAV